MIYDSYFNLVYSKHILRLLNFQLLGKNMSLVCVINLFKDEKNSQRTSSNDAISIINGKGSIYIYIYIYIIYIYIYIYYIYIQNLVY